MKRKTRSRLLKLTLILVLLMMNVFIFTAININNNLQTIQAVDNKTSLIKKQSDLEKTFTSDTYTLDNPNIILDPYDISPLSALIIFETKTQVAPNVTIFGRNNSKDITHKFKSDTKHYLPIYGLYPNSVNDVKVSIDDQDFIYQIKTAPLPADLENLAKDTYIDFEHIDLLNEQFYFVTPASAGYTSGYDVDGQVRWYLTEKLVWDISRLENGNLLLSNERLINPPYYTTGLYEISLLGKIYNEYTLPGGYHHDFFELSNKNLIIASNDFDNNTVEDYIVEVDRNSGEIVKSIDLKEILKVNEGKSESWIEYDWFHNNSVWYDKPTNSLTLSGRHQDIVVNLDYDSLAINYIIGDPQTFSTDYQKHFLTPTNDLEWSYSQHAAMILPDGNIFIFDNGNNRAKKAEDFLAATDNYSRGVIYKVDEDKMEISQVYEYGKARKSDYYSSYISDVDYIDDNHYLIHSGGVAYKDGVICNEPPGLNKADQLLSYTTEVIGDKKIFELKLSNNNYRAEKMSLYYENEEFEKFEAKQLGTLDKTLIDKKGYSLLSKAVNDLQTLSDYNVEIIKEHDRLIVSGEFNPDDVVSVILYRNFQIKEYLVRVSKKPYTAMCLDIFNEGEKITVNKYINDKGLSNKYSILIKINGEIIKTHKFVDYRK